MASKYVPPAMRKSTAEEVPVQRKKYEYKRSYKTHWEVEQDAKQEEEKQKALEQQKNQELTEDNFPRLGGPQTKMSVWGGTKTFASLATEWNEKQHEDEMLKKNNEIEKNDERAYTYRQNLPLPKFHNVRRFVETDEEDVSNEKPPTSKEDIESGWTLVDRKKNRREKTFEEKITSLLEKSEDSVWNSNAPEEYETCWDEPNY